MDSELGTTEEFDAKFDNSEDIVGYLDTDSLHKKKRVFLVKECDGIFDSSVMGVFEDHGNAVRYLNTLNNVDSPDNISFSSDLLTTTLEYKFMGYYVITQMFIIDSEE